MKKYNKYGAAEKNTITFDTEIVSEYKGQELPGDLLMLRCYTKKEECYVAFVPDYENQRVGTTMTSSDEFATAVLQWLIDSGTAERLMKEIYRMLWSEQVPQTSLRKLDLPDLNYSLVSQTE